jgi:hypothetical protein
VIEGRILMSGTVTVGRATRAFALGTIGRRATAGLREVGIGPVAPIRSLHDLDPEIASAVRNARVIVTFTDAGREPAYGRALRVAIALARLSGATLLLVDRSQETWAETPHHRGPFTPEQARHCRKQHLDDTLRTAAFEGVDVRVWVPSLPLIESYEETVSHNRVDLAILRDRYDHPRIVDRLTGTRAARMARDLVPSVPVVQVSRDQSLVLL